MAGEPDVCDLLCLDVPMAEAIRHALPAQDQLDAWAADAKALADPTRLAVALALQAGGRACVCDLSWIVARDDKLVSHHVRQLKTAGLARSEREGKMVMYELTDRGRAMLPVVAPSEARA